MMPRGFGGSNLTACTTIEYQIPFFIVQHPPILHPLKIMYQRNVDVYPENICEKVMDNNFTSWNKQ
jgi:hypothetical protein